MSVSKEVNFAWWNVGVVPPVLAKQTEAPDELKLSRFWEVIEGISENARFDLIAICEVSERCLQFIENKAAEVGFSVLKAVGTDGRIVFDMVVIYSSEVLEVVSSNNIIKTLSSEKRLRIGVSVLFRVKETDDLITFIFSHWPSRLNLDERERMHLGVGLREEVNSIINSSGDDSRIILVGDYNDQPFDASIATYLEATKDVEVVRKKPKLIYNPFWRRLDRETHCSPYSGTYFYKGGSLDRWFTYDQIMFSSAFVKEPKKGWCLDFDGASFHSEEIGPDFLKVFDHLPVYGRILYHE